MSQSLMLFFYLSEHVRQLLISYASKIFLLIIAACLSACGGGGGGGGSDEVSQPQSELINIQEPNTQLQPQTETNQSDNSDKPLTDKTPPVITLLGDNPVMLSVGDAYLANNVTAFDATDGDITESIIIDDTALNTSIAGAYVINYLVTDQAGNIGRARRIVNVIQPPVNLPAGWQSIDIGNTGQQGSVIYAEEQYTLRGAGLGVDSNADSLHFVYTRLSGNGEIRARVSSIDVTQPSTQAGLMIRETLDAGSAFSMISLTSGAELNNAWRSDNNAISVVQSSTLTDANTFPQWLRISREGNKIEMYLSTDNEQWMLINTQTITFGTVLYVGLAITSLDPARLAYAEIEQVSVSQTSSKEIPTDSDIHTANFYVATNGNDGNTGSIDDPLASLSRAAQLAQPGDIIFIREGIYSVDVQLTQSGAANNPITYQSFPGELAIFDGSSIQAGTNVQIDITGSYNILRDIEVRHSPMRGILVSGDNNIIQDVTIHGSHHVGLQFFEATNSQAINVTAHSNYDPQNNGGNADGIQALYSSDISIIGCRVYNNSDDGVDTYESIRITIDRCHAYQNGFDNGDGNGFKLGGGEGNSGEAIVTNSIAYQNKRRGFTFNGSNLANTLLNNSAADNPVNYQFLNATHVLKNNISYRGQLDLDGNTRDENNSWNLAIDDPLFISVDPLSNEFFKLQPASPALNVGVDVGLPFAGAAPDLGVTR